MPKLTINEKLRRAIVKYGNHSDLGRKTKIPYTTIRDFANGRTTTIPLDRAEPLVKALGGTLDVWFPEIEAQTNMGRPRKKQQ